MSQPPSLHCPTQTLLPTRRSTRTQNSRCAKWPNHLVIAHVNDPKVPILVRAFTCDGQNCVRIDRRYRSANDFEPCVRKSLLEQHLQIAPCAVGGTRISQYRRFPENKYPAC